MWLNIVSLALVLGTIVGLPVEDKPFDFSQHKLIRILPKQMKDLERLEELRTRFDVFFIPSNNLEFYWF